MSVSTSSQLILPHWDGGSRKIRFIYLVDLHSFRLTNCASEAPIVPLFLGADLFSNTDIRSENHPRYHAKFAKKGLATKVNFSSDFRFQGLRVSTASNSLWFYSIQGLFRIAFEMYSQQEQLAVLENFQDVWKFHIDDSPLKTSYNISVQLDPPTCGNTSQMQDKESKVKPISHLQPHKVGKELEDTNQIAAASLCDTSADHDYCSPPTDIFQTSSTVGILSTLSRKLHLLEEKLSSICDKHKLETISVLLESIDRYMAEAGGERVLIEMALSLLESNHQGCVYSSPVLNSVARWLGQQFFAANNSISQQVESFKVQHIDQITNLPPAEELASELFPEAMRTLLLHWMGLSRESAMEKRHSEYPILLLILEFANHNLITGVAHVLYSSLICI